MNCIAELCMCDSKGSSKQPAQCVLYSDRSIVVHGTITPNSVYVIPALDFNINILPIGNEDFQYIKLLINHKQLHYIV